MHKLIAPRFADPESHCTTSVRIPIEWKSHRSFSLRPIVHREPNIAVNRGESGNLLQPPQREMCASNPALIDARRAIAKSFIILTSSFLLSLTPPASGSYFPDMLLVGGDGLQAAPVASFHAELDRMELGAPVFKANVPTNSYSEQTLAGDLTDLRAALSRNGTTTNEASLIVDRYRAARAALEIEADKVRVWEEARKDPYTIITRRPVITAPAGIAGLPPEFADYWRASVARAGGLTNDARTIWRLLLSRPAGDRRFKSTWAAYLLGRSWENGNPDEAIRHYREVRRLAAEGFADTIGLAVASMGREARICLGQKSYLEAIELYLDQLAAGDTSAYNSLAFTASDALRDPHSRLDKLAANTRCRKVITAWLISRGCDLEPIDHDGVGTAAIIGLSARTGCLTNTAMLLHSTKAPGVLWLEAVEGAGIGDVESAGQFALAAYQCGKMDLAARWIKRAKSSPLSQWLQAKLDIRNGNIDSATELLAGVSGKFSLDPADTDLTPRSPFTDALHVRSLYPWQSRPPGQQILGELGALHVARREYTEALDCLLRGGFWADAAYIAEQVLTIDELKACVDRNWAAADVTSIPSEGSESARDREMASMRSDIRHLLGRRMMRDRPGSAARPYYPPSLQPVLDQFLGLIRQGQNETIAREARAASYWDAAKLAKSRGVELLGTTVEPDWAITRAPYPWEFSAMDRATNAWLIAATGDELRRVREHGPNPGERFHFQCSAASLAWEAARLMPDNSDETARVLCIAGSWIKYGDPHAADAFYKSLVRRCRNTALGKAADKRRWFPVLDEKGE